MPHFDQSLKDFSLNLYSESNESNVINTKVPNELRQVATWIYRIRSIRFNHFPPKIFGEPAWDILLGIYISQGKGKRVNITEACAFSNSPSTTSLRWIEHLVETGLIHAIKNKNDGRSRYIEITEKGLSLMGSYLAEVVERDHVPKSDDNDG